MKKISLILVLILTIWIQNNLFATQRIISVTPNGTNDILAIKNAIDQAKTYTGDTVTIKLGGGTYNLQRNQATVVKYYISNTLDYSPSQTNLKYIGVYFKSAKNIILDGEGAELITHGEISSIIIDGCENISVKNIKIDAADPTVTEMTVESISGNEVTYKAHATSNFSVSGTTITWSGEYGWSFSGGPTQLYDPVQDITWRCSSPTTNATAVTNMGNKRLKITYSTLPPIKVGWTFQMRDGVRDQVAGFIHESKNVIFDNVRYYFLGNFGIVCQYSENLSFLNCRLAPEVGSGRTNAGFADFLQVSGCKGLVKVEDSYFSGAHDDPINVHGTYLKVQTYNSSTQVKVKFMHSQSWGFDAFFVGDSIEFVDVASMMSIQKAIVTAVTRNDDQNITLTFDVPVDVAAFQARTAGVVVENISWTPQVEIRRNFFSRSPTRAVLISTRRHSVIEDNTFYKMQMPGIYISGDAASWYESGKVCDLTIRNNNFIECGSPAIDFDPTNSINNGYIHSNVTIDGNTFRINSGIAVGGKSVDKLTFTNNTIVASGSTTADNYCSVSQSGTVTKSGNKKVQPGSLPISGLTTTASSSAVGNDKTLANDENTSTYWNIAAGDVNKWWEVDLGKSLSLNGIKLTFPSAAVWQYIIEVSADNTTWTKVIDQSDNTTSVTSHYNSGELGRNIRYVRITFNSTMASLAEVSLFGDVVLPVKKNILTGTVIGTSGSYQNDPAVTKDAVFDFQTGSYFDAPSGVAWAGLDLGKGANFIVDSIQYAPRSGNEDRMLNGKFEISTSNAFNTANVLYTVPSTPPSGYTMIANLKAFNGRYVRYNGPSNGYGNISEVEFYGRTVGARTAQTITFEALNNVNPTTPDFAVTATASSGLPVTFSTSDPTVATIVNGKVHIVNPGTVNIIASQYGNLNYSPAPDVTQPLTIYPAIGNYNIRLDQINMANATNPNGPVQANKSTTGSNLIIGGTTYANGIGTHSPAEINLKLSGTSTRFQATVGVDDDVASKPNEADIEFKVYLDNVQVWTSGIMKYTDAVRTKTIDLDVTGKDYLKLVATIGTSGVNWSDHADWVNTNIAYTGTTPLCVTSAMAVPRTAQTISFGALASAKVGDPDITLTATASSGLPILYASSDTTKATIVNGKIHIKKAGTITIYANQFGNATYTGAPQVSQVLLIEEAGTGLHRLTDATDAILFPIPASQLLTVKLPALTTYEVQVNDIQGQTVIQLPKRTNDIFQLNVATLTPGVYYLHMKNPQTEIIRKFLVKR